ncbi:hypothetical protein L2E82_33952 [Cichorium intybus]|uniref:Uncharacterized protein n=1 Tax=Cichorium intybus TaxID=13427 RepID=A0ACB9BLH0_CICIN|nr:hypothetical protein L2E82_33952 [Cichorium intybus]
MGEKQTTSGWRGRPDNNAKSFFKGYLKLCKEVTDKSTTTNVRDEVQYHSQVCRSNFGGLDLQNIYSAFTIKKPNAPIWGSVGLRATLSSSSQIAFLNLPNVKRDSMGLFNLLSKVGSVRTCGGNKGKEHENFQREEWFGRMMRFRNDAIIILSIICLQLPFELAYAHLYESIGSDVVKFGLTAGYLFAIQYFTQIGGKVIIQRLIISEVLENLMENSLPYVKYSYRKYRAIRHKRKREKGYAAGKHYFNSRVEKEYFKPIYAASIGDELEDGHCKNVVQDFLELALQFGMIMMFACAFPPAFAFAALNNITEIRADALKILVMSRRPVPRVDATIGAWLNIFQFLIVVSICTNCALLVCLYDREGKWNISPGLAAILIMEHVLLLIKFGFSRIVPEEPDWVKANRMKNATQAQNMCSKQLLRNISDGRDMLVKAH